MSIIFLFCLPVRGEITRGTDKITIEMETGGDIDWGSPGQWDGNYENVNGCLFWDGSTWKADETYGHMYFENRSTGQRVVNYNPTNTTIKQSSGSFTIEGYEIGMEEYHYTVNTKEGSRKYSAILFTIIQPDGSIIQLLSRCNGKDMHSAYFDIFLEDEIGGLISVREGGILSEETGIDVEDAIITEWSEENVRGRIIAEDKSEGRNFFYFDVNGGSDMGGMSYILQTGELNHDLDLKFDDGKTFVQNFTIQFKNAQGKVESISFLPMVISELEVDNSEEEEETEDDKFPYWIIVLAVSIILIGMITITFFKRLRKKK
jgi:hypothetical protein